MDSRIRKLTASKKAIFLKNGIFHNGNVKNSSRLNKVRHSFSKNQGYERVVFDFSTSNIPKVYGSISSNEKRIYLDFFDTNLKESIASVGTSHFVENINFLPLSKESLSVEVIFKQNVEVDVFYLNGPGRLVLDIKEI